MQYFEQVREIVADVLSLGQAGRTLPPEAGLLGSVPELDSMAVVQLISALEAYFGITVADDEISASTFATLGSLAQFVEQKT